MKLGFNEATALECKGQSLMADLEMCEKYGFDYIEIRFDCVKDYLKEHTLEELADWFKNHHLKPWAYNTLIFFNQRDEAGEKEIDEEVDFILKVSKAIGFLSMPAFQVILLQDTSEMLCVPVCQLYVTVFCMQNFQNLYWRHPLSLFPFLR